MNIFIPEWILELIPTAPTVLRFIITAAFIYIYGEERFHDGEIHALEEMAKTLEDVKKQVLDELFNNCK